VLLPIETVWRKSEGDTSVGNDKHLENNNKEPDEQEGQVGGDSGENVHFIVDLTAANHVPDLHDDEEVEYEGNVAGVFVSVGLTDGVPEWLSRDVELTSWSDAAVLWIHVPFVLKHWLDDHVLTEEDDNEDDDELIDSHV